MAIHRISCRCIGFLLHGRISSILLRYWNDQDRNGSQNSNSNASRERRRISLAGVAFVGMAGYFWIKRGGNHD